MDSDHLPFCLLPDPTRVFVSCSSLEGHFHDDDSSATHRSAVLQHGMQQGRRCIDGGMSRWLLLRRRLTWTGFVLHVLVTSHTDRLHVLAQQFCRNFVLLLIGSDATLAENLLPLNRPIVSDVR